MLTKVAALKTVSVLSACVLTAGGATAQEVRIGSVGDRSGAAASLVQFAIAGRDAAADEINAQGGLYSSGEKLVLVNADSACDAEAGAAAVEEIISDVVALIGPSCSGPSLAALEAHISPAGKIALSDSATSPALTTADQKDVFFRTATSDSYLGVVLSDLVLNRGITNVSVTYAPDPYNSLLADVFMKRFVERGGTLLSSIEHDDKSEDFAGVIQELQVSGSEALVVFAYYDGSGERILDAALGAGGFDAYMGSETLFEDRLISKVGPEKLGRTLIVTAVGNPRNPAYKIFSNIMQERGADPDKPYAPQGYDSVFMMALALEYQAANPDLTLAEALHSISKSPGKRILPNEWEKAKATIAAGGQINYLGAAGQVDFDANGDVVGDFAVNTVSPEGNWVTQNLR